MAEKVTARLEEAVRGEEASQFTRLGEFEKESNDGSE